MELRASPEVEASSEVRGYSGVDLGPKDGADQDGFAPIAKVSVGVSQELKSRYRQTEVTHVLQPGALHWNFKMTSEYYRIQNKIEGTHCDMIAP